MSRVAAARIPLLATGVFSMACDTWLGLVRLGWNLTLPWPDQLVSQSPLMVCAFLGTLISLERAVGFRARWGYAAPMLVAGGALLLDLGPAALLGRALISAGSLVVVGIFAAVWCREPSRRRRLSRRVLVDGVSRVDDRRRAARAQIACCAPRQLCGARSCSRRC